MDFRFLSLFSSLIRKPLTVGWRPLFLYMEPTDACNQKCPMCYRDRLIKTPVHMSLDLFKKCIDDIQPMTVILSGLGEPLLNPDVFAMVRYAKARQVSVILSTNLTLAGKFAHEIVYSGLDILNVSFDTTNPENYIKIRGTDHYHQIITALAKIDELQAIKNSPTPEIRFTFALQAANLNDLEGVMKAAVRCKVSALEIQSLDYFDADDLKEFLVGDLTPYFLRNKLYLAQRLAREKMLKTNLNTWLRDLNTYLPKMAKMGRVKNKRECYIPWYSTFIEANGDVKLCPVYSRKRGIGTLGNITHQSFTSIWNGELYTLLRRTLGNAEPHYSPCIQCVPKSRWDTIRIFFNVFNRWQPSMQLPLIANN